MRPARRLQRWWPWLVWGHSPGLRVCFPLASKLPFPHPSLIRPKKEQNGSPPPFLQCRAGWGCSSCCSPCLWPAVRLPWHRQPSAAGTELSNATSQGHPEQGCAGGKGWSNNRSGREDELLPAHSSSVRQPGLCVPLAPEVGCPLLGSPGAGRGAWQEAKLYEWKDALAAALPCASCASEGCCKASPMLDLVPPWERAREVLPALGYTVP